MSARERRRERLAAAGMLLGGADVLTLSGAMPKQRVAHAPALTPEGLGVAGSTAPGRSSRTGSPRLFALPHPPPSNEDLPPRLPPASPRTNLVSGVRTKAPDFKHAFAAVADLLHTALDGSTPSDVFAQVLAAHGDDLAWLTALGFPHYLYKNE